MPAFLDFQVTEGIPLGGFEAHHQEEELLQGLWSCICYFKNIYIYIFGLDAFRRLKKYCQ